MTFTCPVLVTTATIYCLKDGLSLEQVQRANELEDVTVACDALVLWEPSTPDLAKYATAIYDQLPSQALASQIESYSAVFKTTERYASA